MKFLFFITLLFIIITSQANAQTGEELFKSLCSSCHTINKGRLVGPDLSGIYEKQDNKWLVSFIRSSQQMIKSGDPDAVAIFNEFNKIPMPDNNLTDEQINSIIDYIRETDKGAAVTAQKTAGGAADTSKVAADTSVVAVTDTISIDEKSVRKGKTYFYGTMPFANGATPCLSCHKINDGTLLGGGRLAIDLSGSYTKLGSAGITAILTNPPFPAMRASIPGELTNEEISSLNSLLKSASITSSLRISFPQGMTFFVLSFVASIFMASFIFLIYDDRKIPDDPLPDLRNY